MGKYLTVGESLSREGEKYESDKPDVINPTYDLIRLEDIDPEDFMGESLSLEKIHTTNISIHLLRKTARQSLNKLPSKCQLFADVPHLGLDNKLETYYQEKDDPSKIDKILINMPEKLANHVCLAGSAATDLILRGYVDIDQNYELFIFGFRNPYKIAKKLTKYLLTQLDLSFAKRELHMTTLNIGSQKIQIYHQYFTSPYEIVNSFDISSCMTCLYKGKLYMTRLAAHSLIKMTNYLVQSDWYSYPNYTYRLAKCALQGFVVELEPNLEYYYSVIMTALRYSLISEEKRKMLKVSPLAELMIMESLLRNGRGIDDFKEDSLEEESYSTANPFCIWKITPEYLEGLGKSKDNISLKVNFAVGPLPKIKLLSREFYHDRIDPKN